MTAREDKRRAHSAVWREVRAGRIVRSPLCSCCDRKSKLQAHHADYSKPLDVVWLCPGCHASEHGETYQNRKPRGRGTTCSQLASQKSRLLRVSCRSCGYVCRVTRKWLDDVGPPLCPCNGSAMGVA